MKNKNKGFTLVELLVVISIIGVLAALVTANISGVRGRARDARRKSESEQIKKALGLYYDDKQAYPVSSAGSYEIMACGNGTQACAWGTSAFEVNDNVYMKQMPKDPLSDPVAQYRYFRGADDNAFCLVVKLENKGDEEAIASQSRCAADCNGLVTFDAQDYATCAD